MKTTAMPFHSVLSKKLFLCVFLFLGIYSNILAQDHCDNQITISHITSTSMHVSWDLTTPAPYELNLFINGILYNTYNLSDDFLTISFPEGTLNSSNRITACVFSLSSDHDASNVCTSAVYDPIATVEIVYRPARPDFAPQCNRTVPKSVKYVLYTDTLTIDTPINNDTYLDATLYAREEFCTCFSYDPLSENCIMELPLEDKKWSACSTCPGSNSTPIPTYCPSNLFGIYLKTSKIKQYQSNPNPFSDFTNINYELINDDKISLHVYNISGQKVATLINEQLKPAGIYQTHFEATTLPKGIYYAVLVSSTKKEVLKMLKM